MSHSSFPGPKPSGKFAFCWRHSGSACKAILEPKCFTHWQKSSLALGAHCSTMLLVSHALPKCCMPWSTHTGRLQVRSHSGFAACRTSQSFCMLGCAPGHSCLPNSYARLAQQTLCMQGTKIDFACQPSESSPPSHCSFSGYPLPITLPLP